MYADKIRDKPVPLITGNTTRLPGNSLRYHSERSNKIWRVCVHTVISQLHVIICNSTARQNVISQLWAMSRTFASGFLALKVFAWDAEIWNQLMKKHYDVPTISWALWRIVQRSLAPCRCEIVNAVKNGTEMHRQLYIFCTYFCIGLGFISKIRISPKRNDEMLGTFSSSNSNEPSWEWRNFCWSRLFNHVPVNVNTSSCNVVDLEHFRCRNQSGNGNWVPRWIHHVLV